MKALVEHPRWRGADLSSLRFVNSGSQVVPLTLIEAFHSRGVPVTQVYGSTETGPVSIVLRPEEAMANAGRVGRPALGVQVSLADDGEILLRTEDIVAVQVQRIVQTPDVSLVALRGAVTGAVREQNDALAHIDLAPENELADGGIKVDPMSRCKTAMHFKFRARHTRVHSPWPFARLRV
jgi:acyl-CoA synthetase (AMP-forming)/AMP-acid ligase II